MNMMMTNTNLESRIQWKWQIQI